jgi:hypothetical protein
MKLAAILKALPLVFLLSAPVGASAQSGLIAPAHRVTEPKNSPRIHFPPVCDTLAPDLSIRLALQRAINTVKDTLNTDGKKTPILINDKIEVLEEFIAECERIAALQKFKNTKASERLLRALQEYEEVTNALTENGIPLGYDPNCSLRYLAVQRSFFITVARSAWPEGTNPSGF